MLLENNIPQLQEWLDTLAKRDPARALKVMIDLAPYVIPRLASQEVKVTNEREEIDYSKLSDEDLKELWEKTNKQLPDKE